MKKFITAAAVAALTLGSAFVAAPAFAEDAPPVEVIETVTPAPEEIVIETVEVVEEFVVESAPLPVVEVPAEEVAVQTFMAPSFTPYQASVSWLLPATWNKPTQTPSYTAAIYDQTRVDPAAAPSCRWLQNDVYWIDNATKEATYNSLGDVLTMGEDGSIYQSHTYTFTGGNCVVTTVTVPDVAPLPPTCDAAGSLPFLGNPAAQNPNGYEFPGQGYRVYISPAFAGAGTYTLTFQKVGPGFDVVYPAGTKVSGNTTQTVTVLGATGYQNTDPTLPCYVAPQPPLVENGEWIDGEFECGDTEVATSRTVTTTTYTFNPVSGLYSPSEPISAIETGVRTLDADEVVACPVPPTEEPPTATPEKPVTPVVNDVLAFTGQTDNPFIPLAVILLIFGGVGLVWLRQVHSK